MENRNLNIEFIEQPVYAKDWDGYSAETLGHTRRKILLLFLKSNLPYAE